MQRLVFFVLGLTAMTALSAQGQVIRCTHPKTGQVNYSDQPCESGHAGVVVEPRKSHEEIMAERLLAAQANEQKYRNRLAEIEAQQRATAQAPHAPYTPQFPQQGLPDKSASYECRQVQKDHETVSSIRTGTEEERRNRINASIVKVNATCGMQTAQVRAPVRPVLIYNQGY